MALNIDNKIESWKNKLLDLGKRNRLINYRETKRSTLTIKYPNIFTLWDSFVINEEPLEFPFYDDLQADDEDTLNTETVSPSIETNQNVKEMQKTLRNLRNKAKMAIEEQGINILYLAFGFLHWTEAEYHGEYVTSPLILVPVRLTVESISSPFVLQLGDDEIVLNPALKYKLENDCGILLPEFDEETELNTYLQKIQQLIQPNKWDIVKNVGLSLFSFLKINMYFDLDKHKDNIKVNPIIRAICGDVTAAETIPEELNNYDFDKKIKPVDAFQIVDADSSQEEAILCAKQGISFVLQGPPGTGKSQTITNIIAECLSNGKKVLFVSEKMAALDVVYRRLTAAGLDDFCLVLHSHKAKKKEILNQLRAALNLARNKVQLSDEAYMKLDMLYKDKEKLNQYATEVYEEVKPFGKSIYWVNGILANLSEYEDVIFPISDIRNTTRDKYNQYLFVLNEFKNTIGRMSEDYSTNPWHDACVANVTNELRHDVGARFPNLSDQLREADFTVKNIFNQMNLNFETTYENMEKSKCLFSMSKYSPTIPYDWIKRSEFDTLLNEISWCEKQKDKFTEQQQLLNQQLSDIQTHDKNIFWEKTNNYTTLQQISLMIEQICKVIQDNPVYSKLNQPDMLSICIKQRKIAEDKVLVLRELRNQIIENFEVGIFDFDYNPVFLRYKTEYTSFAKYFKRSYSNDKKSLRVYYKPLSGKLTDELILLTLDNLKNIDEINESLLKECSELSNVFSETLDYLTIDFIPMDNSISAYAGLINAKQTLIKMYEILRDFLKKEEVLSSHYSFMYEGIETSWADIRNAVNWAIKFKNILTEYKVNNEFAKLICTDKEAIKKCSEFEKKISEIIQTLKADFLWFSSLFDNKEELMNTEMSLLSKRVHRCANGLFLLEEWIDFLNARRDCEKEGLTEYIEKVEKEKILPCNIIPVFKKRFFRLWLDSVLPEYPAVLNFRRINQENVIQDFIDLDKMQFEIAKARIKGKLINSLPLLNKFTSSMDEMGILKRELSKQRRIMPIRKLFQQIPNLLLTLKPCLMMSPLSVSLFLEAETYKFDTVIFDEASQVRTENAIGAISRAKQVIIAGDSKQLPPTNFFSVSNSDSDLYYDNDEDEEEEDSEAYESVLDEANLLPEKTLLWHYRSRHESLIAFSNAKIYHNSLITFPSNIDGVSDNGVEYIYVKDGFYDRGGKKGNIPEAKKVAELVFEHFRLYPNRSLGVITFGEVQQHAIETIILQMRMTKQKYEPFFDEEKEEPFFIKNLENVQGDERDTIIFSIGYAKDAAGEFRMNFGPLNKSGGERRLNVAITRAKYNVKLVGSILPTDIDTNRVSSQGPKLLRAYIDFAINGIESLQKEVAENDIIQNEAPFEEAIYSFLDRKGYKVAKHIGCSAYRIDMAVKHPTISGHYVIGIECDGAAYHSAQMARERDRLRQEVLEKMGWKIYRIWSADWIKDPVTEGQRLINAIEAAIKSYKTCNVEASVESSNSDPNDFIFIKEKNFSAESSENPYGFAPAVSVSYDNLPRSYGGYLAWEDGLMQIVNTLYPVHYDLICHEFAPLLGQVKATVNVRRNVDHIIRKLGNKLIRKGDFFFPAGYKKVLPRVNNQRKIDYISTEELAAAMYAVLERNVGFTKEILCEETAHAYNFHRMTQKITSAMNQAFEMLLDNKKIIEIEGKIDIVKHPSN